MNTRWFVFLLLLLLCNVTRGDMMMDNAAQQWGQEALRLIKLTLGTFSPPTVARTLSVVSTCMYDASVPYNTYEKSWSAFDIPKRPTQEMNDQNLQIAVSYGAYRAITHLFQDFPQYLIATRSIMVSMGLDPNDMSELLFTAQGIGNKACKEVLRLKDVDGWNFNGREDGTKSANIGVKYTDYTNYFSKNDAQTTTGITDCAKIRDLNSWQALKVPTAANVTIIQKWAAPIAFNTKMFVHTTLSEIDLQGPALLNTNSNQDALEQNTMILNMNGMLSDRQKMIAEFWADGPGTTNPPGHWYGIALDISIQYTMTLRRTVNLLFALSNANYDAGVLTWTAKRLYDSVRPITAIQCLNSNVQVKAWRGPYKGSGMINGSIWQPYQAPTFVTPGFAEWPSGHSSFSSASATILKNFFGDDDFGLVVTITKGKSLFEPKILHGHAGYIAGVTDIPNIGYNTTGYSPSTDITFYYQTYDDAANCAAQSRLYGGIHYTRGRDDGARIGRKVGQKVWNEYVDLVGIMRDNSPH